MDDPSEHDSANTKPSNTVVAGLNLTASETVAVMRQMQGLLSAQQQQLQFHMMQQQMAQAAHMVQQQILQQQMHQQNIGNHIMGTPCVGANPILPPFPILSSDQLPVFDKQPDFSVAPLAPNSNFLTGMQPGLMNLQGRLLGLTGIGSLPAAVPGAAIEHGVGGMWPSAPLMFQGCSTAAPLRKGSGGGLPPR